MEIFRIYGIIKAMISVIMPAYNAEESIGSSVKSILGQSYRDIELIVVNDGSTDGTLSVLSSIAEGDRRLRVITVPNGGPAKARNAGLRSVSPGCTHIMFCDSDDEYVPGAFGRALEACVPGIDIVVAGFRILNPDGTVNDYSESAGEYDSGSFGPAYPVLYKANLLNQVWGKLFRAGLLLGNGIEFPDYRWGEDRLFLLDCLGRMSGLAVIPDISYLYKMQTGESLISGFYGKKIQVCIEIDRRIASYCEAIGVTDRSVFTYMFIKSIVSAFTNLYSSKCTLSGAEKRKYVSDAISDGYVMGRMDDGCKSSAAGLAASLIKTKNVSLILFAARFTVWFSRVSPGLFQKIKHRK